MTNQPKRAAIAVIRQERLEEVMRGTLSSGSHESYEAGMCVLEAVSYVAGEPWSDAPTCACPIITAFLVAWNDGLPDDASRDRLLKPLIPLIVGSRSTKAVEERRSYLALNWLIRVYTAAWLDLVPLLREHAEALRSLVEIADMASAAAAGERVRPARDAAGDAARAAWAAWAAGDAARAAGAAGDAAWAAGDAARAAGAAGAALKPPIERLQTSAVALIHRMLEVV